MEEEHVSWREASKYLIIPLVLALAGFCGWTVTALSAVPRQVEEQVNSTTSGILQELTGIRNDLQNLRIDIAKLQVEIRLHQEKGQR
jgi:predicted negative regulator of RcsB-dependent stress response